MEGGKITLNVPNKEGLERNKCGHSGVHLKSASLALVVLVTRDVAYNIYESFGTWITYTVLEMQTMVYSTYTYTTMST